MKHFAALLPAALLCGCAWLQPAPMADDSNPLLTASTLPYQYPDFARIRSEHYGPAIKAGMAAHLAEVNAIAEASEAPSFDNTIVALERSGELLDRSTRVFFALASADNNPTLDATRDELAPLLSGHENQIFLNSKLFARIDALYQKRDSLNLSASQKRLLERYYTDFQRAGAELPDVAKDQLKDLNVRIASLETQFAKQVLSERNDAGVLVTDVAELAGLSATEIQAAAQAATSAGHDGHYLLKLLNYSAQPMLAALDNRALREKVMKASLARGLRGNANDNTAVILELARLRADRAQILGFPTAAAYELADRTAKTPQAVNELLSKLAKPAVKNAQREQTELEVLAAADGITALKSWDWPYYAEKLRQQRYQFDEAAVKPYLEMDRVLQDGVFYMAKALYGLTFKARPELPVYNPDVRVWEVFNEDGSALGLFLFDPFARDSKRGGAWMNALVGQSHLRGTKPVVTNTQNITKPADGGPVLLTLDEVNTMFHEFGHALHGLFSDVEYPYFGGTSVPRDFVEYPSQVHEMWATWPEVLANYARHYETNEPMPQELVDRFMAAKAFNQGYATTSYLAAALLDQAWHQLSPKTIPKDVDAFEKRALKNAGIALDTVPPRYRSAYFSHIFAGGYSAGYYSYIWSEVLDAQSVEWFKQHGGLKRLNGDWFRENLLSRGGSVEAMELFRLFTGTNPDIQPLLIRRGLTGQ